MPRHHKLIIPTLLLSSAALVVSLAMQPNPFTQKAHAAAPTAPPEVDTNDAHPQLERARAAAQAATPDENTPTTLTAKFEQAYIPTMKKISDTQFSLDFAKQEHCWFLFRLNGVAGKTIRIDLDNININKWWSVNPVYRYEKEPAASFVSPHPANADDMRLATVQPIIAAANGPTMPELAGNGWHFIPDVWSDTPHADRGDVNTYATLSFVHKFEQDQVDIAFRVPYGLDDENALIADVKKSPTAQVIDLPGKSPDKHDLHIFQIAGNKEAQAKNPGIVFYGREQADTPDTSWVVAGALRRLLLDDPVAKDLRSKYNFFFIPLLDVDASVKGQHMVITNDFRIGNGTANYQSVAYATFFQNYVQAGGRIDLAFNFMNIESAEGDHLLPPLFPANADPTSAPIRALHAAVRRDLVTQGFRVNNNSWQQGTLNSRFGGWLTTTFGGIQMIYEVNAQQQQRHLSTDELQALGAGILRASNTFMSSPAATDFETRAAATRAAYAENWKTFGPKVTGTTTQPFTLEYQVRGLVNPASTQPNVIIFNAPPGTPTTTRPARGVIVAPPNPSGLP